MYGLAVFLLTDSAAVSSASLASSSDVVFAALAAAAFRAASTAAASRLNSASVASTRSRSASISGEPANATVGGSCARSSPTLPMRPPDEGVRMGGEPLADRPIDMSITPSVPMLTLRL